MLKFLQLKIIFYVYREKMQNFLSDENVRLDIFLAQKLKQSRSQVASLIENGGVCVNGEIQKKNSLKLKIADEIQIKIPLQTQTNPKYEIHFELDILYEDEDLLVLNKIPQLPVHGASSVKQATLVDWLVSKNYTLSNLGGEIRAGLVHRLDKNTSGAIIIAKNNFTHQKLSEQLQDKTLGRIYLALIDLPLKEDKIIINKALARCVYNPIKKSVVDEGIRGAKRAKSAFVNLLNSKDFALITAKLFTGRTHQIRAHLASLNRHILGDILYGYRAKTDLRMMLHSYVLYFIHPKTKEKIFVKAPLMNDFETILLKKFSIGEIDEKIAIEFLLSLFDSFA